ncbi:hypothetical protein BBJ28_00007152, partial [Nothophytophthora sp. Chile5]
MGNASARLLEAASFGRLKDVERALKGRADVKATDEYGKTALMSAAGRGSVEIVRLLLDKGVDVGVQDHAGRTALSWAAFWGQPATARMLLLHGAAVDAMNADGETPLMRAAAKGHVEVVRLLLEKHAAVNAQDAYGNTALHFAALWGQVDTARELLDRGASADLAGQAGVRPLTRAAGGGHVELVRLLLERQADAEAQDDKGRTALSLARYEGQADVVALLQDRQCTDIDAIAGSSAQASLARSMSVLNTSADKALLDSASTGNMDDVESVFDRGAPVDTTNEVGETPLMLAAGRGHLGVVRFLMAKDAAVNAQSESGWTALMFAADEGRPQTAHALLTCNALVNKTDKRGFTALMCACVNGHVQVARLLLEYKADAEVTSIDGLSALTLARFEDHCEVFALLERHSRTSVSHTAPGAQSGPKSPALSAEAALLEAAMTGHFIDAKQALRCGADVHTLGRNGNTPLMCAARAGSAQIVRLLLEKNADPGVQNHAWRTAIHIATIWGNVDAARELVSHREVVDVADRSGWTPLMTAASNGDADMVRLLLDNGADADVKDPSGQTTLSIASVNGDDEIVKLLEKPDDTSKATPEQTQRVDKVLRQMRRPMSMSETTVELSHRGTTIWDAAKAGDLRTVRAICGQHSHAYCAQDDFANSPLYCASLCGQDAVVAFVQRAYERDGRAIPAAELSRCLLNALSTSTRELLKRLASEAARYAVVENEEARAAAQNTDQIQTVAEMEEAHVARENKKVMEAIVTDDWKKARRAIRNGAKANSIDSEGRSPLFWAASNGAVKSVEMLLEEDADVNARDCFGRTALFAAASGGHVAIARELLEHKASPDADDYNVTPLMKAAKKGHTVIVRLMLEKNADAATRDADGQTALHFAILYGQPDAARELLIRREVVDAQDSCGWTPLMRAAQKGDVEMVQSMLSYGIDTAAKNGDGQTARDVAEVHGRAAVVALLEADAEYVNLEQIHEQPGSNWALRSNNLKALLRAVELFYHDELGQICPADELVDPLLIAKQNDVHEAAKLTELLLGCAVQCPNKSEYIHPILQMDASE